MEDIIIHETKTVVSHHFNVTARGYEIHAIANILENKISDLHGDVMASSTQAQFVHFKGTRNHEDDLVINYHNIPSNDKSAIDVISAVVDAAIAKYQQ